MKTKGNLLYHFGRTCEGRADIDFFILLQRKAEGAPHQLAAWIANPGDGLG